MTLKESLIRLQDLAHKCQKLYRLKMTEGENFLSEFQLMSCRLTAGRKSNSQAGKPNNQG